MTREELNKHWEILKAFKEGRAIEVYWESQDKWVEALSSDFHLSRKYRIKPELKYIPFTFEDRVQLLGKQVKHRNEKSESIITHVTETGLGWTDEYGWRFVSYEFLLREYKFIGGTPCGKLIEE